MKTPINNLDSLKAERARLHAKKLALETSLKNDVTFIKEQYLSTSIVSKVAASMVPASIRHSKWINNPINYIAKLITPAKEEVVHTGADNSKGDKIRNMVLAIAQTAAPVLISTLLKRRK